jgi:glycosyltransferase involved in cell wall biosynthesis
VVLAETPKLVKAYPHSLLESLAAGKPILVSGVISMADYVSDTKCGVVVPELGLESLAVALETMMRDYNELQSNASRIRS